MILRLTGGLCRGSERGDGVAGEFGGMAAGLWQTTESRSNIAGRGLAGFGERLPFQHICKSRSGSAGGDAALGLETGGNDLAALNGERKPEHVTADRICHFGFVGGVWKVACVVRVVEVGEDSFAEHARSV